MHQPFPRPRRTLPPFLLAVILALVVACNGDAEGGVSVVAGITSETPTPTPTATAPSTSTDSPSPVTPAPDAATTVVPDDFDVPLYDPLLVRDDVDCTLEFISSGGGETFADGFIAGHYVVDGVLGEPCLGEDERLLRAWQWLRIVASPEDLETLILLAGFEAPSDLLAYVEALTTSDEGVAFQMTVNLGEAELDDIELALTMAHELTHVFTGSLEELDRGVDESQCTTYFEGEGCYVEGSYIARWTDAFWDEWIEDVDPTNSEDEAAYDRCFLDPSFLGSYAATNPEEDFAETFSAYVFSVPVDEPTLLAKYEFFEEDPYLSSFRDRVMAAGIPPLPNQFEGCGF